MIGLGLVIGAGVGGALGVIIGGGGGLAIGGAVGTAGGIVIGAITRALYLQRNRDRTQPADRR